MKWKYHIYDIYDIYIIQRRTLSITNSNNYFTCDFYIHLEEMTLGHKKNII